MVINAIGIGNTIKLPEPLPGAERIFWVSCKGDNGYDEDGGIELSVVHPNDLDDEGNVMRPQLIKLSAKKSCRAGTYQPQYIFYEDDQSNRTVLRYFGCARSEA